MGTIENNGLKPLKMPAARPAPDGVRDDWCDNPHLSGEKMTPLEARLAAKNPGLVDSLSRLRNAIGNEKYEKYISSLQNLTKGENEILVVAGNFMQRSLIERECVPAMKDAFGVARVRIVA